MLLQENHKSLSPQKKQLFGFSWVAPSTGQKRGEHPQDLHLRRCPQTGAGRVREAPGGGSQALQGVLSPRVSASWCQHHAGMPIRSAEHSPCLLAEINPSITKAGGEPQPLLSSMKLFTVPISRDFHPFKQEAGLVVVSKHHPGEQPPVLISCKLSSNTHPHQAATHQDPMHYPQQSPASTVGRNICTG